ncbi:MAG: terminase family protein, partial [Pyrinomonadaceae bacterium]|nr:terminase family protein [Pyrinomonadaceae bacterium]
MQDPTTTEIYQACFKLFVEYGGRHISRIERELRARGHEFHRRTLYNRGTSLGWIARYHWRNQINRRDAETQSASGGSPSPCESLRVSKGGIRTNKEEASQTWNLEPGTSRTTANGQQPPADPRPNLPPFPQWLREVSPNMKWNWRQHRIICGQLERFTRGEINRLMIFIPPRHGKSELVTVRYTAWRIKREPETNVIVAGYGQRLADRFSRKIRNVLADAAEKGERLREQGESQESGTSSDAGTCNCQRGNSGRATQDTQSGTHTAACQPPTANSSQPTANLRHPSCPCCSPRHSRRINTVSEWETHAGGGLRAVGVGGAVTGFGANFIVIDDPVKNRAQAESKTYRDRTWDWYNDDVLTRLEPGGGIILIQTRWHHDDLAGRLLREMDAGGEQWEVVGLEAIKEVTSDECQVTSEEVGRNTTGRECAPSKGERIKEKGESEEPCESPRVSKGDIGTQQEDISRKDAKTQSGDEHADIPEPRTWNPEPEIPLHPSPHILHPSFDDRLPGEALCPERFDVAALEKLRRQLGTYAFSALYQQSPTPAEGGLFKRHWFSRFVTAPPPGLTWVRGYDLAVSTGTSADHTASFRCAFDDNGVLYIDGGFRARIEYPDQRRYILERLEAEPNVLHGVETALHGMAFVQDIRTDPRARGRQLKGVKVGTDKVTRALT